MAQDILSETRGATVILTFNRPDKGNALSFDMATQFFNLLKPITVDRAIHAVVLRGAGGNFMSGLDMALYGGDFNTSLERANQMILPYHSAIRELQQMEKPVLAVADGLTSGPGMSILLSCDLVIAGRGAKFNCGFTSYAMTPDGGASMLLARKAGLMKANELLMLSETFSAEDAQRWNIINGIADDDKVQSEGLAWADRLSAAPTRALGAVKRLVMKAFEQDVNTQMSLEHTLWGAATRSFDFREAVRAIGANRPPKFTGS
jgi:2-(1,2-epoxy-1,2-dihydrophenyl)acetyl-CoA isomerase